MPVMADDGAQAPARRAVADLFLLDRTSPLVRVLIGLVTVVVCALFAQAALLVQHHFAASDGGRIARFLARGPTAATEWTGWGAAVFFGVAVIRLRRGAPEPPAGRAPVESMTLPEIRAGLLREYTVVRAGLVALGIAAALDAARAVRYVLAAAAGDALAGASEMGTGVEAAGLVVATVVLALWAFSFRAQLHRLGALG